jgi:hypothetical protein
MLFGLFGKKSGESERPANRREVVRTTPDTAPIVNISPADKSVESEQIDQQRRKLTQGILSLIGVAALGKVLPACVTYEDYTKKFNNNFDFYAYPEFTEEDLETANSRNQVKMTAEDCRWAFQRAMDQNLPFHLEIDDVFHFQVSDDIIAATDKILTPENQQALMKKYPFIRAIQSMESPQYPAYYEFTTDWGNFFFGLNKGQVGVANFDHPQSVQMRYNTSEPSYNLSPEYRDFQRTIYVGGKNEQGQKVTKSLTCEKDHGVLEYRQDAVQAFSSKDHQSEKISDTQTFINFLRKAKGTPVIENFLKAVLWQNQNLTEQKGSQIEPSESFFNLISIRDINQLQEIFRLLPSDPQIYGMMLCSALKYHKYDREVKDEFRNPVTTLQSGWADCDDFAVINYFWAYLHKFQPNMTVITNTRDHDHHVFVWYRDAENRFTILDNNDVQVLDASYTVEKYLQDFYVNVMGSPTGDTYEINYNGPV